VDGSGSIGSIWLPCPTSWLAALPQQLENLSAKSGGAIRLGCIAAAIENGKIALDTEDEVAPALAAVLRGFREAARQGGGARTCARGALEEIGGHGRAAIRALSAGGWLPDRKGQSVLPEAALRCWGIGRGRDPNFSVFGPLRSSKCKRAIAC
jgi:hypothetical protein